MYVRAFTHDITLTLQSAKLVHNNTIMIISTMEHLLAVIEWFLLGSYFQALMIESDTGYSNA